jgi:hypothetical protein
MAFEDFIKEKTTTINKNVSYRDDNEEEEDYAVPVAASADPLAESDESKGKDDEKEGDELEDKGDKKVDSEDDKEKADHYKGAVKSDDAQIKSLKKDAKFDKEEEDDAEKNESVIMSFSNFVNEAYDKVVWGGNKGDDSESEEDEEDYEADDKTDEGFDEVTLGGNKGDKSKTKKGEDYEEDDDKDESVKEAKHQSNLLDWFNSLTDKDLKSKSSFLKIGKSAGYDKKDLETLIADFEQGDESNVQWAKDVHVKESKVEETKLADFLIRLKLDDNDIDHIFGVLGSRSGSLDKILKSTKFYKTVKDHIKTIVSLANDAGYNAIKEGVGEVITKVEGDAIKDELAGADGIAIPVIKGDGPETAAGIAGDIMNKGKVKNLSALAGKLVTPDQKVTEVIPDEANDVSEDGIEIPLVKEANIDEGYGPHAMSNGDWSIKDLKNLKIAISAYEKGYAPGDTDKKAEVIAHIIKRAKVVGGEKLLSKIKSPFKGEGLDKYFQKALKESVVNEEDITSDDQFKEYATAILKKAFGADFDEAKATEVIDGLISKHDGDYGAMVGALQSTMGS